MSAVAPKPEPKHEHKMFKFNCLVEGYVPYHTLYVCFGCGRAFAQKIEYQEVGVRLP